MPVASKTLTVKVAVKPVLPKLSFKPGTVSFNLTSPSSQNVKLTAADKTFLFNCYDWKYKVTDAAGNDCTSCFRVDSLCSESDGTDRTLTVVPVSFVENGTYTLTYYSGSMVAKLIIKVKTSLPKIKLNKTYVTLNADIGVEDVAVLKFILPDGYAYSNDYDIRISDSNGSESYNIRCDISEDSPETVLVSISNSRFVNPGETYKIKLACKVFALGEQRTTNYVTVNVKIASQKNGLTPITQKLTAGTLDLSKKNAVLEIGNTYTGWNGCNNSNMGVQVYWYIYAGENLVAHSENDSCGLTEHWFTDVDPTDGGITLKANTETDAWINGEFNPLLKYTIKVRTVFPSYKVDSSDLVLEKAAVFKLSCGKQNIKVLYPNVILSRYDCYDSRLVKLSIPDGCRAVAAAEIVNPALTRFDCKVVKDLYDNIYLAIGWKNDTLPFVVAGGTISVNLYLEGNSPDLSKPNSTVKISVKTS